MSFALEMAMAPRVSLEVSPALVVFGELLTLPCAAMESVVEGELARTPRWSASTPATARSAEARGGLGARCARASPSRERAAGSSRPPTGAAAEPDTQALLHAVRMETGAADAAIAEHLVDSLDEHGLLDRSCAQIAADLGVAEAAVARVLDVIRALRAARGRRVQPVRVPTAAAGRPRTSTTTGRRLTRAVIADHLPALARGHFTSIAKALGVSRAEVQQVLDLIRRRLRPYPAFDGNAPAVSLRRSRRGGHRARRDRRCLRRRAGGARPDAAGRAASAGRGRRRGGLDPAGQGRSSASCTIAGAPCSESPSTRSSASGTSSSAGRRR